MNRSRLLFALAVVVLTATVSAAAIAKPSGTGKGGPFDVALIGDIPYNAVQEEQTANLDRATPRKEARICLESTVSNFSATP